MSGGEAMAATGEVVRLEWLLSEAKLGPWKPERSDRGIWLTNEAGDSLLVDALDVADLINSMLRQAAESNPKFAEGWQAAIAAVRVGAGTLDRPTGIEPILDTLANEGPRRSVRTSVLEDSIEGALQRDANRPDRNHYARFFDGPPPDVDDEWLDATEAKMREALGDPFVDDAAAIMLRLIAALRSAREAGIEEGRRLAAEEHRQALIPQISWGHSGPCASPDCSCGANQWAVESPR